MRELNEREIRAAVRLLMSQLIKTRVTIAKWLEAKHRPTMDELIAVGMTLKITQEEVLNLGRLPPSTGHSLDFSIERISQEIEELSPGFMSRAE